MIYQYRCKSCDFYFEIKASLAEKESGLEPECPRCKKREADQVFQGVGMAFGKRARSSNGSGSCCGPGGC